MRQGKLSPVVEAQVLPEVIGSLGAAGDHRGEQRLERLARGGAAFEQVEKAGFVRRAFDGFAWAEQAPRGGLGEELADKRAELLRRKPGGGGLRLRELGGFGGRDREDGSHHMRVERVAAGGAGLHEVAVYVLRCKRLYVW